MSLNKLLIRFGILLASQILFAFSATHGTTISKQGERPIVLAISIFIAKILIDNFIIFKRTFALILFTLHYSAGAEFSKGLLSSDALLSFNGKLEYNIRDIFHTVCKVNVDSYPIDKQECKLVFGSWGHHGGKIILNSEVGYLNIIYIF